MPKRHQNRQAKEQAGRNNPKKSTIITTGTPRKQETARKEAEEHRNPGKTPQIAKVPPAIDPTEGRTKKADSQVMAEEREKRSGSDSIKTPNSISPAYWARGGTGSSGQ